MHTCGLFIFMGRCLDMAKEKPSLTIEQQVELLQKRNLNIPKNQMEELKKFLLNNNYYRISGYTLTLRQNDKFYPNASFDNIKQIYQFDKRLRHSILSLTEEIEVRVKSMLAYYHSQKYGPMGYKDVNTFHCADGNRVNAEAISNFLTVQKKAMQQQDRMSETELFLKHFKEKNGGELPIWAYVEVLTISDISKMYGILDIDIQKAIAKEFGYCHNTGHELLAQLLHNITIVRNICAHGGRLYNRNFIRKPKLSGKQKQLLRIEDGKVIYDRLFSYILVIKALSLPEDFDLLKEHLLELTSKYPFVDMKYYGFPDNWIEIV